MKDYHGCEITVNETPDTQITDLREGIMSNKAMRINGRWVIFDDTCWPMPPTAEMFERINHADPDKPLSRVDRRYVASVLGAYAQLIKLPARERNHRVRRLREAIQLEKKQRKS